MLKSARKFLSAAASKMPSGGNKSDAGSLRLNAEDFAIEEARRRGERKLRELSKDAKRHGHKRREERKTFSAIAMLGLPDRGFALDGVISEASRGGCTFRPAALYIEERTGEQVMIEVEGIKRKGIIRATRVNGYGIQLFDPFTEEDLEMLRMVSVNLAPVVEDAA